MTSVRSAVGSRAPVSRHATGQGDLPVTQDDRKAHGGDSDDHDERVARHDALRAALRAAALRDRSRVFDAIGARVGVGSAMARRWSDRQHLYELAPWVRRAIEEELEADRGRRRDRSRR